MNIKARLHSVLPHLVVWSLFIIIPFLLPITVVLELRPDESGRAFLHVVTFCAALIITFYFNYSVLVPKFLCTKRYVTYVLICLVLTLLMSLLSKLVVGIFYSYGPGLPQDEAFRRIIPLVISNELLFYLTTLLGSAGLQLNNRWKQTEKERIEAQLSYLKMQVNPHFLFNTLNSVYSAAIDKAPEAADMVDKLSQLMRYSLQESPTVPVEKEIDYISKYMDLQKVRSDDSVKVHFEVSGSLEDNHITPMLLIPFIENAFKHGINSEQESDIMVWIHVSDGRLHMIVSNKKVKIDRSLEEASGLGIENTRNRLGLIYPDRHTLKITDDESVFQVALQISLT